MGPLSYAAGALVLLFFAASPAAAQDQGLDPLLFANRDVQICHEFAEMSLAEALRMPWPTLADASPAGTVVEAGRPILTIFADGDNGDEVEQRLRQRVAELERQIYGDGAS